MASPGALGSVTDVDRARSQGPSHTPSPSEHQGVQAAQAAMPSRPASHGSGAYPPPNPSLDQAIAAPGGAPMSSTTPPVPAPQPSPRTGLHVSPPAATPRQETPQGRAMKYASPDQGAPRRDLQASDQYTAIANAISQASPGIVRQVLRDNWERCLLGSEYHVAFVVCSLSPLHCWEVRECD